MIKEYIVKLADENDEDLKKLEKQMKDMLEELSCAEEWSETLQIESNSQKNIFSPRNADPEINTKIEKATNTVQKIKKEIEYIRDLIETHLKKKEEYEKMMSEIEDSESNCSANNCEKEKNNSFNTDRSDERTESEYTENNLNEEKKSIEQNDIVEKEAEVHTFLSNLYSKAEVCLACLTSDKNRCKKELNEMKNMIKKYAKELENK